MTSRVARLERRGIVERRPCPHDARGIHAHLTDDRFAILEAAARDHVTAVRALVLDPLTREELLSLGASVGAVHAAMTG